MSCLFLFPFFSLTCFHGSLFFFFFLFFSLRSRLNLVELLDKYCMEENREANKEGEILIPTAYDFLYLPIDFKYVCNCLFYIYINEFRSPSSYRIFIYLLSGKRKTKGMHL